MTGGTRGIGAGRQLEGELKDAKFLLADAEDPCSAASVIDHALKAGGGAIRGLVNNVGTAARKPFHETSLSDWDRVFAINTRSVCADCCWEARPSRS